MKQQVEREQRITSGKNNKSKWLGIMIGSIVVLFCIILPNSLGAVTIAISHMILGVFGLASYPGFLGISVFAFFKNRGRKISMVKTKIALLVCATLSALFVMQVITTYEGFSYKFYDYMKYTYEMSYSMGGWILGFFVYGISAAITPIGCGIVFVLSAVACIWVFSGRSTKDIFKKFKTTKAVNAINNNEFEMGKYNNSSQVVPKLSNSLYVGKIEPSIINNSSGDIYQMMDVEPGLNLFGAVDTGVIASQNADNIDNKARRYNKQILGEVSSEEEIDSVETSSSQATAEDRRRASREYLFGNTSKTNLELSNNNYFVSRNYAKGDYVKDILPPVIQSPPDVEPINKPPKFVHDDNDSVLNKLSNIVNPATVKEKIEYFEGEIINGDSVSTMSSNVNQQNLAAVGYNEVNIDNGNIINAQDYVNFSQKANITPPKFVANIGESGTSHRNDNLFKLFHSNSALQTSNKGYYNDTPPINADTFKQDSNNAKKDFFNITEINDNKAKKALLDKSENIMPNTIKVDNIITSENVFNTIHKKNRVLLNDIEDNTKNTESSFEDLYSQENFQRDRDFALNDDLSRYDNTILTSSDLDKFDNVDNDNSTSEFNGLENSYDRYNEEFDSVQSEYIIDNTGYYNYLDDVNNMKNTIQVTGSKKRTRAYGAQTQMDDILGLERLEQKSLRKKKRKHYTAPPISLLANLSKDNAEFNDSSLANGDLLVSTLKDFGLPVTLDGIVVGPAVTRYELSMPQGVSVKKVEGYTTDIEYSLACPGHIRIETPIPGKRAIGIEIPNIAISTVGLKSIFESKAFSDAKSPLTVALGKDIAGEYIVASLDKMPHLLIAGSTGSGKSACLNAIITSLLYKSRPDDVRLILIDPKRVEFNIYSNLPHLLLKNIITEPEQTVNAFDWAIKEMGRRYSLLSEHYTRNIVDYNNLEIVKSGEIEKLPYIVIIVDELADLMMTNKRAVEDRIRAIAQKARAAGIHLVLATQRPSVDVITGTIKTNLPGRIAFSVSNFQDSKTILDCGGAESLLGRGDMLFQSTDTNVPRRIQGAYITSEEVATVVNFCKENNVAEYDDSIETEIMRKSQSDEERTNEFDPSATDPLFVRVLAEAIVRGNVSCSSIQRQYQIGYPRASRIVDQMERRGFVAGNDGQKPRKVLLSIEEFRLMYPSVSISDSID